LRQQTLTGFNLYIPRDCYPFAIKLCSKHYGMHFYAPSTIDLSKPA
jgi:hypothetical protein